jgi:hypothetical protein
MVYDKRNKHTTMIRNPKISYGNDKEPKPHFAFITEELTKKIEQIEARQMWLETGFDKLSSDIQDKITKLGTYIDKALDHENKLLGHIIEQQKNQIELRKRIEQLETKKGAKKK